MSRVILVYGHGDKSVKGFPTSASLIEYLEGGIFQDHGGRYRYSQKKAANIIVLTRDGLAFGHLEVASTITPTNSDRKAYPPVKQVYLIHRSVRYGNQVRMSEIGISNYQFGKSITEEVFEKILGLAGTNQDFSASEKRTALVRNVFDSTLSGLQIDWKEDHEIEFIGMAMLAGKGSNTSASCKKDGRTLHYLYPARAEKNFPTLRISYDETPDLWKKLNWDIAPGVLTIKFTESDSPQPEAVSWWKEETRETFRLEEGDDWTYIPEKHSPPLSVNVARGRLAVSRLERPEQQALRNKLISERAECLVTGTRCTTVLEACHILPVKNGGNDSLENVLLLRRDLHALFDAGLLQFHFGENDCWIVLNEALKQSDYGQFHDLHVPIENMTRHRAYFQARLALEAKSSNSKK